MYPEACNPSIRVDLETQVRDATRRRDGKVVLRIAAKLCQRQDLCPAIILCNKIVNALLRAGGACLDRAVRRVISAKVSGVDNNTFYCARHPEPDNAPVKLF